MQSLFPDAYNVLTCPKVSFSNRAYFSTAICVPLFFFYSPQIASKFCYATRDKKFVQTTLVVETEIHTEMSDCNDACLVSDGHVWFVYFLLMCLHGDFIV